MQGWKIIPRTFIGLKIDRLNNRTFTGSRFESARNRIHYICEDWTGCPLRVYGKQPLLLVSRQILRKWRKSPSVIGRNDAPSPLSVALSIMDKRARHSVSEYCAAISDCLTLNRICITARCAEIAAALVKTWSSWENGARRRTEYKITRDTRPKGALTRKFSNRFLILYSSNNRTSISVRKKKILSFPIKWCSCCLSQIHSIVIIIQSLLGLLKQLSTDFRSLILMFQLN